MKPPIAVLRMNGHATALCIEDLINVGHTYVEYRKNGSASVNLLKSIGFAIQHCKSVLDPKQTFAFLIFCINSVTITVQAINGKKDSFRKFCK